MDAINRGSRSIGRCAQETGGGGGGGVRFAKLSIIINVRTESSQQCIRACTGEVLAARTWLSYNELSADFGPAHLPIIIDHDAGRQRCACRCDKNPLDAGSMQARAYHAGEKVKLS